MKREERRERERRNTRANGQRGSLCTKPPLESATSDLEDQDHDSLDNIRLSRSCRQNAKKFRDLEAKLEFKDG